MKTTIYTLLINLFFLLIQNLATAQGCSDAGFCTLSSYKHGAAKSSAPAVWSLAIGTNIGKADNNITAWGQYVEIGKQTSKNNLLAIRINSLGQNGNGISQFALADLYINNTYSLNKDWQLSTGLKLPFTNGNRKTMSAPLPMDYQASLGTVDLILGASRNFNKWQFSLALQQPLIQNKNMFVSETLPSSSVFKQFVTTNNYKRSGDVMLRISYPLVTKTEFTVKASLLPIYHLSNDKYTNAANKEVEIAGSQGLTLNGTILAAYNLNNKSSLGFNLGAPFVVRKARPDGLTRSFVAGLEYKIRF
jgi:hypothetical protein